MIMSTPSQIEEQRVLGKHKCQSVLPNEASERSRSKSQRADSMARPKKSISDFWHQMHESHHELCEQKQQWARCFCKTDITLRNTKIAIKALGQNLSIGAQDKFPL